MYSGVPSGAPDNFIRGVIKNLFIVWFYCLDFGIWNLEFVVLPSSLRDRSSGRGNLSAISRLLRRLRADGAPIPA